ncbi:hypothetical protein SLA2020_056680 [Shorea laevis]
MSRQRHTFSGYTYGADGEMEQRHKAARMSLSRDRSSVRRGRKGGRGIIRGRVFLLNWPTEVAQYFQALARDVNYRLGVQL